MGIFKSKQDLVNINEANIPNYKKSINIQNMISEEDKNSPNAHNMTFEFRPQHNNIKYPHLGSRTALIEYFQNNESSIIFALYGKKSSTKSCYIAKIEDDNHFSIMEIERKYVFSYIRINPQCFCLNVISIKDNGYYVFQHDEIENSFKCKVTMPIIEFESSSKRTFTNDEKKQIFNFTFDTGAPMSSISSENLLILLEYYPHLRIVSMNPNYYLIEMRIGGFNQYVIFKESFRNILGYTFFGESILMIEGGILRYINRPYIVSNNFLTYKKFIDLSNFPVRAVYGTDYLYDFKRYYVEFLFNFQNFDEIKPIDFLIDTGSPYTIINLTTFLTFSNVDKIKELVTAHIDLSIGMNNFRCFQYKGFLTFNNREFETSIYVSTVDINENLLGCDHLKYFNCLIEESNFIFFGFNTKSKTHYEARKQADKGKTELETLLKYRDKEMDTSELKEYQDQYLFN